MKQIVSNYTYSPATNVVTLSGVNIDADQLLLIVAPETGRTMYNFASGVTGAVSAGADTRVTLNASTAGLTTTSPLVIFYDDQVSTQTIAGTVTANENLFTVVTVQTITGGQNGSGISFLNNFGLYDVTFAAPGDYTIQAGFISGGFVATGVTIPLTNAFGAQASGSLHYGSLFRRPVPYSNLNTAFRITAVTTGMTPAPFTATVRGINDAYYGLDRSISGTVTANVGKVGYDGGNDTNYFPIAFVDSPGGGLIQVSQDSNGGLPISGTVTVGNSVTISAFPSGALTTRFGSVTTANTAQITSAVTNTSRKYLLAQNISAGTVTIGIGFSPTTTQGIQLPAGGGLTFDAFCPTGAVYWLGAVTGAAFTILEG